MSTRTRLRKLERQTRPSAEPIRILLHYTGPPASLEEAKCHRSLLADGNLMEVITLYGSSEGILEEDLDRFVSRFPIEPYEKRLGLASTQI
jgi:hypothetical protein